MHIPGKFTKSLNYSLISFLFILSSNALANEYLLDKHFNKAKNYLKQQNIVLAIPELKKAQQIAVDIDATEKELDVIIQLLELYLSQSDATNIISTVNRLEEISVKLTAPRDVVRSYRLLGMANQAMLKHELARDYYSVASEFARKLNDPRILSIILNETGLSDASLLDHKAAISSFAESYKVAASISDYQQMLSSNINELQSNILLNNNKSANQSFQKAEKLFNKIGSNKVNARHYIKLSILYRQAYQRFNQNTAYLQKSLEHLMRAKSIAEQYDSKHQLSIVLGHLGYIYAIDGQVETAIDLTEKAIEYAKTLKNQNYVFDLYSQLAEITKSTNNPTISFQFLSKAIAQLDYVHLSSMVKDKGSFNKKVEILFIQAIETLLNNKTKYRGDDRNKKIANLMLQLRYYELMSYCLNNCDIEKLNIDDWQYEANQALIMPFLLNDQLLIIAKFGKKTQLHTQDIKQNKLLKDIANWSNVKTTNEFDKYAKNFYRLLMSRIEPNLKNKNINDLIFLPSRELLSIPYTTLKNDENYLIENYQVSISSLNRINNSRLNLKNIVGNLENLDIRNPRSDSMLVIKDMVRLHSDFRDTTLDSYSDYSLAKIIGTRSNGKSHELAYFKNIVSDSYVFYYNFAILGIKQQILNLSKSPETTIDFSGFVQENLKKTLIIKELYREYIIQEIRQNSTNPIVWSKLILMV